MFNTRGFLFSLLNVNVAIFKSDPPVPDDAYNLSFPIIRFMALTCELFSYPTHYEYGPELPTHYKP